MRRRQLEERLEANRALMRKMKERGDWNYEQGDLPERLAPLPVPAGYRSLSELGHQWSLAHSVFERVPAESDPLTDDELLLFRTLLDALADGSLATYAVNEQGLLGKIPATCWLNLGHEAGALPNLLRSVVYDCLTGDAFEPSFVGAMAVVEDQACERFVAVGRQTGPRDPARPWRDHRSVSAWLSSRQSTAFIDEILEGEGNAAPRPVDRNRALYAYLQRHGESIEFRSIESRRRPSRMTE